MELEDELQCCSSMSNEWNADAELERLEKARERIRQLRAKVKFLNDHVSGSQFDADSVERLKDEKARPSSPLPSKPSG